MSRAAAGALLAAAAVVACAQPGRPPGGEVDRSPPRVIETVPAALDTLTDLDAPVVIRFDERLSIRLNGVTELREAVLISPETGAPRVTQGRRRITIRPAGGWLPDRVYRVVVLPVFSDLFGNRREEPVDLVFSTGAPITESALAGFVSDRLTGRAVADARVWATRRIDGERYVAVTDTGGFFALRFVPAGAYDLLSWTDQDRDREPDFFETQDTADTAFGVGDTAVVEMAILPMDTTPARLARVEPIDSAKLRLVFDDYFAPGPIEGVARLYLLPDTTLLTASGRLVHGSRLDSIREVEAAARAARDSVERAMARQDSIQALQDSLQALPDSVRPSPDSIRVLLGVDTAQAARDTTGPAERAPAEGEVVPPSRVTPGQRQRTQPRPGQGRPPGAQSGAQQGGARQPDAPLPAQELVLLLPGTLQPDTTYYLEVEGLTNLRLVPGGGGAARFRSPPADTVEADTAAVDTAGVNPAADSIPPDSIPPDSIPPDTIPPDTIPATPPAAAPSPGPAARAGRGGAP